MSEAAKPTPAAPPEKPSFVLGGSKTFSLPMYGLMVGVFGLFLVAALALWAPEGRFVVASSALTQIVSLMLGLAGAGGITLGARDAMTKGLTSSNSAAALTAIKAQSNGSVARPSKPAPKPAPELAPTPHEIPPGMRPD